MEGIGNQRYFLIVDCHSFPQLPLPYELDRNPVRPDICIGTDQFHTPSALKDVLSRSSQGWATLSPSIIRFPVRLFHHGTIARTKMSSR